MYYWGWKRRIWRNYARKRRIFKGFRKELFLIIGEGSRIDWRMEIYCYRLFFNSNLYPNVYTRYQS